MLLLLSPAKTLDFDTPSPVVEPSTPAFLKQAGELIGLLRTRSVAEIGALMHISEPLAALNVGRHAAWRRRGGNVAKPALLAFAGDVYRGLDAASLTADDLAWAQRHVAILSGLYGVLRPLDRLQPYRLEMGTRLPNAHGPDLYAFWRGVVARHLDATLKADASPVVVNLASQEYAGAVDRAALKARVVDCVFEDWSRGAFRVVGVHAKRARGLMARYAIRARAMTPGGLHGFDLEGYGFDAAASRLDRLVFRRGESPR